MLFVREKCSLALSCWTAQYLYIILSTLGFSVSSQSPFSSITRCQSSSREVFATEPLTCHSGHWRPINENSAEDFPPLRDYRERQEPSLSHLGCSSPRKTAIVTTSQPQAALLHSMISGRLIRLFQTIGGILMQTCWAVFQTASLGNLFTL